MATTEATILPDYDELIGGLADRLRGLSAVRGALSDVTAELQAARGELARAQLGTERVIGSGEELLDEVRRLEPSVIVSAMRDGFSDIFRDSSQNLDAIQTQLCALDEGRRAEHEHIDAVLAQLDQRISADVAEVTARLSSISAALSLQQDHLSERFDGIDRSLSALGSQQSSVLANCRLIQREQEAFTQRQETVIVPALEHIVVNQATFAEGHATMLAQIAEGRNTTLAQIAGAHTTMLAQVAELSSRQDVLADREQRIAEAVSRIQKTVEATQSLNETMHHIIDQHAPIVVSAVEAARRGLDKQLRFLRAAVVGLFALVLIVLVAVAVF